MTRTQTAFPVPHAGEMKGEHAGECVFVTITGRTSLSAGKKSERVSSLAKALLATCHQKRKSDVREIRLK